jgi:hypothetical protein
MPRTGDEEKNTYHQQQVFNYQQRALPVKDKRPFAGNGIV